MIIKKYYLLGLFLIISCKTTYHYIPIEIYRIQYNPHDTIKEEKWIQPEYIYSELYPVT